MIIQTKIVGLNFTQKHGDDSSNVKIELLGSCTPEQKKNLIEFCLKNASCLITKEDDLSRDVSITLDEEKNDDGYLHKMLGIPPQPGDR